MPGNELEVVDFLISNKGSVVLPHIGLLTSVKNPGPAGTRTEVSSIKSLSPDDSTKKADVYLNDEGVSIKQKGSSNLFNRLQRATALRVFAAMGLENPTDNVLVLDKLIDDYHHGKIDRNRHWSEAFSESEFKSLLHFLMMEGSPRFGFSDHPAKYILTAPVGFTSEHDLSFLTFDEFFEGNKDDVYLTLRRQWLGQSSQSEHNRCKSIIANEENAPWVYSTISGSPASWLPETVFPAEKRRTVYMVFIEIIPGQSLR